MLTGHQGAVLDFEFNPFDEGLIATGSEDGYVRLFRIPEEGLGKSADATKKEPLMSFRQSKKVSLLAHHKRVQVLGAVGYDHVVRVYDLEAGAELTELPLLPELPLSMDWNFCGNLLACTTRDRHLY